jgi:hypothetical protein
MRRKIVDVVASVVLVLGATGAASAAVWAADAAPAAAATPPLTAAQQWCGQVGGTFVPNPFGTGGYMCQETSAFSPHPPSKVFIQQCENAYKGTFDAIDVPPLLALGCFGFG